MSKGLSNKGGEDKVSLNTSEADDLLCNSCHKAIPFMPTRENRIDCEEDTLVTYHLICYDIEMFGKVTKFTLTKIQRLEL